jgi:hypothetical protein
MGKLQETLQKFFAKIGFRNKKHDFCKNLIRSLLISPTLTAKNGFLRWGGEFCVFAESDFSQLGVCGL